MNTEHAYPLNDTNIQVYRQQWQDELDHILRYWQLHMPDHQYGGFLGGLDNDNQPILGAPKGSVLHARILWTFSEAHRFSNNPSLQEIADRAYTYLSGPFTDPEYGGVFWSLTPDGQVLDTRKQVYAQAFALYGIAAYYAVKGLPAVREYAISLYRLIEQHAADSRHNGYLEAFSLDWGPLDDLRLSAKDANEKKTANTHLHIIEAYAALYRVWPDEGLRDRIVNLLVLFDRYFIDPYNGHLRLFFDETWVEKPDVVSYGHDIEAAWLLQQCAEVAGDKYWIDRSREHALRLAKASLEGLDTDGGLWYEFDPHTGQMVREKHWWPQAEAMVGFYHAWQQSQDDAWRNRSAGSWTFIQQHIIDHRRGEWYWGVTEDYAAMPGQDKAGFWKCPYHNGRACMEMLERTGGPIA